MSPLINGETNSLTMNHSTTTTSCSSSGGGVHPNSIPLSDYAAIADSLRGDNNIPSYRENKVEKQQQQRCFFLPNLKWLSVVFPTQSSQLLTVILEPEEQQEQQLILHKEVVVKEQNQQQLHLLSSSLKSMIDSMETQKQQLHQEQVQTPQHEKVILQPEPEPQPEPHSDVQTQPKDRTSSSSRRSSQPNKHNKNKKKGVKFAKKAKVYPIHSTKELTEEEKSVLWWQRSDYEAFKVTEKRLIDDNKNSQSMSRYYYDFPNNTSKPWLATTALNGNIHINKKLPQQQRPQEKTKLDTSFYNSCSSNQTLAHALALSMCQPNRIRASSLEEKREFSSTSLPTLKLICENGNSINTNSIKWWQLFGHSRRGIEHVVRLEGN